MSKLSIAVGVIFVPGAAAAHLGQVSGGSSQILIHYLTDPLHVMLTGAVVLLVVAVRRLRLRRQPVRSRGRRAPLD